MRFHAGSQGGDSAIEDSLERAFLEMAGTMDGWMEPYGDRCIDTDTDKDTDKDTEIQVIQQAFTGCLLCFMGTGEKRHRPLKRT